MITRYVLRLKLVVIHSRLQVQNVVTTYTEITKLVMKFCKWVYSEWTEIKYSNLSAGNNEWLWKCKGNYLWLPPYCRQTRPLFQEVNVFECSLKWSWPSVSLKRQLEVFWYIHFQFLDYLQEANLTVEIVGHQRSNDNKIQQSKVSSRTFKSNGT